MLKTHLKLLFLAVVLVIKCHCQDNNPVITTSLGKIQGYLRTSHGGRIFSAFEGIPYAKPPTGNRRFEAPESPEPWTNILKATSPTTCPQTNNRNQSLLLGQEDCLHINVYVPREHINAQEKLNVIVHIHGGAFMHGSGHMYAHPDYLMDSDVVFITFNYRLGIFGFLSTEDDTVPGNNGLKDQVMALAWIQSNIASFGGDPDSVTLTGLSAGGASVHLHYFSNMSKGLFHRGFSQSGVALNPWVIHKEPLSKTRLLGEGLGCPTAPNPALIECLKQKPYKDILAQVPSFFQYLVFPLDPFGPVIEKGTTEPFLDKDPYQLLVEGQVQDLPWLVSNTAHEGVIATQFLEKDLKTVDDKWDDLAPMLLDYNYTLTQLRWKSTADKIKDFYLGKDQAINEDNLSKFIKIFSDRHFLVGSENAVRLQANVTKSPVYYYYFSYSGDYSSTVPHGKDRKYFFGNPEPNARPLSPNDLKMKNVLLEMLVSFAKTGEPRIDGVSWEPTLYNQLKYLHINTFERDLIKQQITDGLTPKDFWKSLGFLEDENIISSKKC